MLKVVGKQLATNNKQLFLKNWQLDNQVSESN